MSSIIIVDDEPMFLNFAKKCITSYFPNIEVCGCFGDGQEALSFLTDHPVDLVLTDIEMPNMDGLELIEKLYYTFPQCVTIVISSYSNFDYARHAIKYDVSNYLLKPLNINELVPCIEKALELSANRKALHRNSMNLINERMEVFYSDLLLGEFHSKSNCKEHFGRLNLPFSIEESAGTLLRFTINDPIDQNRSYNTDTLIHTLKNILTLTLQMQTCYFARKSGNHFEYIVIGPEYKEEKLLSMTQQIQDTISLSVKLTVKRRFDSLLCFISEEKRTHEEKETGRDASVNNNAIIAKAIEYMEENYSKNISRDDVAQSVYLSPAYFSLVFKETTKYNFIDYLTRIRMQKAIELLATPMKIGEISDRVGYASKRRFNANFRAYTSFSPTEYRQKVLYMERTSDETETE